MQIGMGFSLIILGLLFYGLIAKVGYDMFRKVGPTTVANFSFIFSALMTYALYHLLPLNLPKVFTNFAGNDFPFLYQGDHGLGYRDAFALICFCSFYFAVKAYLLRALELSSSHPPQKRS